MIYSIFPEAVQNNIAGTGLHSLDDRSVVLPENFNLACPFSILISTYHVNNRENIVTFMEQTPARGACFLFTKEEIEPYLVPRGLHRHNFYELLFVVEGPVYQNIEHHRHFYPSGSCCLMNQNIHHMEEYNENQSIVFLQFTADFILSLLTQQRYFAAERTETFAEMEAFFQKDTNTATASNKSYIDFIPKEGAEWIDKNVHRLFQELLIEMETPSVGSTFRVSALFDQLLCLLFDSRHYHNTPVEFGSTAERKLFDDITAFLAAHSGRVSRAELQRQFHYSGDYLYKTVQKYTGLSLFDYGMKFCLREAADLLCNTSLSVQEICQRLRFTNQTHFYQLFREKYHMTPREYRRKALK